MGGAEGLGKLGEENWEFWEFWESLYPFVIPVVPILSVLPALPVLSVLSVLPVVPVLPDIVLSASLAASLALVISSLIPPYLTKSDFWRSISLDSRRSVCRINTIAILAIVSPVRLPTASI